MMRIDLSHDVLMIYDVLYEVVLFDKLLWRCSDMHLFFINPVTWTQQPYSSLLLSFNLFSCDISGCVQGPEQFQALYTVYLSILRYTNIRYT